MSPSVFCFIALLTIFMLSTELANTGPLSPRTRRLSVGLRTSAMVTAMLTIGEMTILSVPPLFFFSVIGVTTVGGLLAPVREGGAA